MGIFESLDHSSEKAMEFGGEYIKKSQEYYQLKVFQQLASTTGMFCKIAVVGCFLFLGVTFLAVGGTLALGNLIENMVIACLVIAACLFFIGGMFYRFRSGIDALVIKKLSNQYFD
jgi:hypothetical protein